MTFFKRHRLRLLKAERDAADAETRRKLTESRWPEIHAIARQARATPDADVLTRLFQQSLRGRPSA